jgi:iron complex outermembrane receptor protein
MLAAVLTVGLTGSACADPPAPEQPDQTPVGVSEELELLKEEETVSIASRYEQPISQAPSNVYVITDEDIRQSGATDLPTVLRRVPGLEVMQMSGADFNVSARGNNQPAANKMLVMVDGRSIYVDVQATVYWKSIPVTLPEIKRIEVLKGPAAAIYGFNAFDGIINIITKSPEEMRGTTLQFGGGELGTISSSAIHAGTVGNLGYRLSIGRDQNQQWRSSDALAFRSHKFNIHTEYALPKESKLLVSGGLTDMKRFDGTVVDVFQLGQKFGLAYTDIAYQRPNFFVRAWWSTYNSAVDLTTRPDVAPFIRLTDRNGNSTGVPFIGNTYNIESQHSMTLWADNKLAYGLNYRHNTLSGTGTTGFNRENRLGLYIQDEWRATDKLTFVAGARYDLDTFINPTVSPRVAILYVPFPDHTFRLSASVAYRPPTIFESNNDTRVITPAPFPILSLGSHNLDPEQIVSYEAGYQGWFFRHRLRARADIFFNHISDLVDGRSITPTLTAPINDRGQADIYGGEAGGELLINKWLSGFANVSYQQIGQSFTENARRGGPRLKFNVGVRAESENGLSADATFHHVDAATYPTSTSFSSFAPFGVVAPDPRVGGYNLLNLRAGYRFWQQKAAAGYMRDAEIAVSVFNALNDEHKEHPLGDLIGRRVMGWLTLRF